MGELIEEGGGEEVGERNGDRGDTTTKKSWSGEDLSVTISPKYKGGGQDWSLLKSPRFPLFAVRRCCLQAARDCEWN